MTTTCPDCGCNLKQVAFAVPGCESKSYAFFCRCAASISDSRDDHLAKIDLVWGPNSSPAVRANETSAFRLALQTLPDFYRNTIIHQWFVVKALAD